MSAGETFDDRIRWAIDASTVTLCLISSTYQQSENCLLEYQHAGPRRRLPLRIDQGLDLVDEIRRNREVVPEKGTTDEIVRCVADKIEERADATRDDKTYLSCDRDDAWEKLQEPRAEGKPRLYLVGGDEFQAHHKLLERVRIFHELEKAQTCTVNWKGWCGPAPQEFGDVLARALAPRNPANQASATSTQAADLLKQRTSHVQLVLLHKSVPGDPNTTQEQHLIVRYYQWLSAQPMGPVPLACIQPIHWDELTIRDPLRLWPSWQSRQRAKDLASSLNDKLKGWDVVDLRPLPTIGKKQLRKHASDHGYPVKHFVRHTYTGRSVNTLDAVRSYAGAHGSENGE
jgi:hypothetical protein